MPIRRLGLITFSLLLLGTACTGGVTEGSRGGLPLVPAATEHAAPAPSDRVAVLEADGITYWLEVEEGCFTFGALIEEYEPYLKKDCAGDTPRKVATEGLWHISFDGCFATPVVANAALIESYTTLPPCDLHRQDVVYGFAPQSVRYVCVGDKQRTLAVERSTAGAFVIPVRDFAHTSVVAFDADGLVAAPAIGAVTGPCRHRPPFPDVPPLIISDASISVELDPSVSLPPRWFITVDFPGAHSLIKGRDDIDDDRRIGGVALEPGDEIETVTGIAGARTVQVVLVPHFPEDFAGLDRVALRIVGLDENLTAVIEAVWVASRR